MKLLFVTRLDTAARAVSAITRYAEMAPRLGHEVAVFGEPRPDFPNVPHSRDATAFDFVIFMIYEAWDFPELPHLAYLLDGVPRERRVILDCTGAYNDTVTSEHDSNHMTQLNGHEGWEWIEGFEAVAGLILQPTLRPQRVNVRPFLFFGFDPSCVTRTYPSATEAARAWSAHDGERKPLGLAYVGHNWQRWSQVKTFLEAIEPIKDRIGLIEFRGWAWDHRPEWATEHSFRGLDVDPTLMQRVGATPGETLPFHQVIEFQGCAKFCPVFQRPLYNHLGLVTNRTFETFCSDTLPLLMLPEQLVEEIHGRDALLLTPGNDVSARIVDMLERPEVYWDAVLKTRECLASRHSYERRFDELVSLLSGGDADFVEVQRAPALA
jgi:hypothetical protein